MYRKAVHTLNIFSIVQPFFKAFSFAEFVKIHKYLSFLFCPLSRERSGQRQQQRQETEQETAGRTNSDNAGRKNRTDTDTTQSRRTHGNEPKQGEKQHDQQGRAHPRSEAHPPTGEQGEKQHAEEQTRQAHQPAGRKRQQKPNEDSPPPDRKNNEHTAQPKPNEKKKRTRKNHLYEKFAPLGTFCSGWSDTSMAAKYTALNP